MLLFLPVGIAAGIAIGLAGGITFGIAIGIAFGGGPEPFLFCVRSIDRDARAQIYSMITQKKTATSRENGDRQNARGRSSSYGGFTVSENNDTTSGQNVNREYDGPRYLPTAEDIENGRDYSTGESTDEDEPRFLPTAEDIENGRDYSLGGGFDELVSTARRKNRPTRSKGQLRHELLSEFSVPDGAKATLCAKVDAIGAAIRIPREEGRRLRIATSLRSSQ